MRTPALSMARIGLASLARFAAEATP